MPDRMADVGSMMQRQDAPFAREGDLERRLTEAIMTASPLDRRQIREAMALRWWSELSADQQAAVIRAEEAGA